MTKNLASRVRLGAGPVLLLGFASACGTDTDLAGNKAGGGNAFVTAGSGGSGTTTCA